MVFLPAPPQLLSAYAFAVRGDDDLYLKPGTHLRTYSGLGPSFAVTPLVVRGFDYDGEGSRPSCQFYLFDPEGRPTNSTDLGQAEYLRLKLIYRDPDHMKTTSITVFSDTYQGLELVELLDAKGRVMASRTSEPFTFAAPIFSQVRVRGRGYVGVNRRMMPLGMAIELIEQRPLMTLGLPLDAGLNDDLPWYLGGIVDREAGMERVKDGAPLRLNPMDRQYGGLDAVSPSDEADRVSNAINALQVEGGLDGIVDRLVREGKLWPWQQPEPIPNMGTTLTGAPQTTGILRQQTLQLAAADPGLARYLGFAGRTDALPTTEQIPGQFEAFSIFGLFALDVDSMRRFAPLLGDVRQYRFEDTEIWAYRGAISQLGIDIGDQLQRLMDHVHDSGCALVPFETVIEACEPWLPPHVTPAEVFERHWQPIDPQAAVPSRYFRAGFRFPDLPMVSQAGIARYNGRDWVGRNERLPDSPVPPSPETRRAVPRLFATEIDPRIHATEFKSPVLSFKGLPVLADYDILDGTVPYAVWGSDMFGRFEDNAEEFSVTSPPRPKPPRPVLRFHFERDGGEIAPGQSPGKLTVWLAVPEPLPASEPFADRNALAKAIVVPRLDDLQAGSFDLLSFHFAVDGMAEVTVPLNVAPGIYSSTIDVPQLPDPDATLNTYRLYGYYLDSVGATSDGPGETHFTVRNYRKPAQLDIGTGLIWTSDPGPSPEVELRVKWPSQDGRQYRVYLTDQAGMGMSSSDLGGEAPPSRGLIAKVGATKTGDKLKFRMLTDPPLVASGGVTYFTTTLPRTLETVQFLKVVPLGSDGDEFDFDSCRVVALAVPESRRPIAPLLGGRIDPATGTATLKVSVSRDELDETVLQRDEPGLFDPAKKGKEPPKAIIRRAVASIPDPIYARRIGDPVAMTKDPATGRYAATITDDNDGRGLEPWVNYIYWAEWQMSPERRLPAHTDEVAGAVQAVDPSANLPRPRPFSAPSAPRVLMRVPAALPAAPAPAAIALTVADGPAPDTATITVTLTDPPQVHKKAEGAYRLALWTQWNNAPIAPVDNVGGSPLAGTWPEVGTGQFTTTVAKAAGDVGLQLRLAYVDPLGRMSDITSKPT